MKALRNVFLIFLLAVCGTVPLVAHADLDAAGEAKAHNIFESIMSPFCPGRLLNDCPSSAASELKTKIRERLDKGEDPDQILESLFTVYGDKYRAIPATTGFGLVAWVMPAIFVVLGISALVVWLKKNIANDTGN